MEDIAELVQKLQKEIKARQESEFKLADLASRLQILHDIDHGIIAASSSQAIAECAFSHFQRLVPHLHIGLLEFDPSSRQSRVLAVNSPTLQLARGAEVSRTAFESLCQLHGKIARLDASLGAPKAAQLKQAFQAAGMRFVASFPLVQQGKLIGCLFIGAPESSLLTPEFLMMVNEVALSLSIAFNHARLREQATHDAETKAILLDEINHRIKNNLAAIIGILLHQRRRSDVNSPAQFQAVMSTLASQIQGMASAHRLISASEWTTLSLQELTREVIDKTRQIIAPLRSASVRISPITIQIKPQQANSLALIISELTINAFKHAIDKDKPVSMAVQIMPADGKICYEFADCGPGYPESVLQQQKPMGGLQLIDALVRHDLKGTLTLANNQGAVATLCFPQNPEP